MADIFIHPTADVSDTAVIGDGTKIWHQCQVREGAHIGKNCILGKGVYVDKEVIIGNECKIQNYACIYHGVSLEDRVFIGPHVTFTNDMYPRSCAWETDQAITTTVKTGASIGANATIVCGVSIGEYAMVGAGSVVTKDVPAHALIMGTPGIIKGQVCYCGHPLENRKCPVCKKVIKVKQ